MSSQNPLKMRLRQFEEAVLSTIDRFFGYPLERRNFRKAHGYELDLANPRSFNEKICWKKIHDRNPLLPVLADKYAIRGYVAEVLGPRVAEEVLIPLLLVTENPESLDFTQLPDCFVVKSNHGSGNNVLVHDKSKVDRDAVVAECKAWMKQNYGVRAHEWAYKDTPRKILVEAMLGGGSGQVPPDYKFSMIHGECAFIQVDSDRFRDHSRTLYDPSWTRIDVAWKRKQGPAIPRPEKLEEMLALASRLARGLDFVRIDFYVADGRIYLGEMTNYPERGRGRFTPRSFDFDLGARWTIQPDYWRQETNART